MSLSKVEIKTHPLHTYKFYPRPYYFHRRICDLFPRFKRVIGVFPETFHDEKLFSKLQRCQAEIRKPPLVVVIGYHVEDLELSHIVVTEDPLQLPYSPASENGLVVPVCYVKTDLTSTDYQGLERLLQDVFDRFVNKKFRLDKLLVVCDIGTEDESVKEKVREHIVRQLEERFSVVTCAERIILGSEGVILSCRISEFLEGEMIDQFVMMYEYLERFMKRDQSEYTKKTKVIDDEDIKMVLESFVRDAMALHDMREIAELQQSAETEGLPADKRFVIHALNFLSKNIRGAVMPIYSLKYKLTPWICSQLLEEIDFNKKMKDSISNTTRSKLHRLDSYSADKGKETKSKDRLKNDYMIASLKDDMSEAMVETEKTMSSAEQVLQLMNKMMFEICGYLRQTKLSKRGKEVQPVLEKKAMNELLSLEDVFGAGIIYDKLEIHVTQSTDHTKTAVAETLKEHGYTKPYSIQNVIQEPKPLANMQHEHGKLIKSRYANNHINRYREGTLGAFFVDNQKDLYALTCAHVVDNESQPEHDVMIEDKGRQLRKLGVSKPEMTVPFGNADMKLVDIAAVKVTEDMAPNCIRYLKDEHGMSKPGRLTSSNLTDIYSDFGPFVYKFGAKTDLTKGLVCCSDYALSFNNGCETSYLLLIDKQPDVTLNTAFADAGDSGSIVCAPSTDSDSVIAISMISSGELKIGNVNDNRCLSFLLSNGLDALRQKSGVQLSMP